MLMRLVLICLFGFFSSVQAAETTIEGEDFEIGEFITLCISLAGWSTLMWAELSAKIPVRSASHILISLLMSSLMVAPHIYYNFGYKLSKWQRIKLFLSSIKGMGVASLLGLAIFSSEQTNSK